MTLPKLINLGLEPTLPKGWRIHFHRKMEGLADIDTIKLVAYGRQKSKSWEEGKDILHKTRDPLNAIAIETLLAYPKEIPESWKGKIVCFWGTLYTPAEISKPVVAEEIIAPPSLYVRCLVHSGGEWKDEYLSVNDEFGPTRVSAELPDNRNWISRMFAAIVKIFT